MTNRIPWQVVFKTGIPAFSCSIVMFKHSRNSNLYQCIPGLKFSGAF